MSTEHATLTGAYAVDALVGDERAAFERHLSGCAECAQEVAELRAVTARLAGTTATTPPDELRHRVRAEVAQTRQLAPPTPQRPVDNSGSGKRARSFRATRLAAVAAVLGIVVATGATSLALNEQHELEAAHQQMARTEQRNAAMADVLRAPDASMVTGGGPGSMRATTVLSEQRGKAAFLPDLPPPPDDRAYQLWFLDAAGAATSGGLLHRDGATMTPMVTDMPGGSTAMAVTTEPAGGSAQPTAAPFLQLNLHA